MCRLYHPEPVVLWLAPLLCLVASCGLIDLRPVGISVFPEKANTILPARDTAITVSFDIEPDRLDAERAFTVSDSAHTVVGDFCWSERGFSWKPVVPWSPGQRYRLMVSGTIRMSDGREARPAIDIPFYAIRSAGLPITVGVWPESGASIEVPLSAQPFLRLEFSCAMDTLSVEKSLVIQPTCESATVWNMERTIATLFATAGLVPCAGYRWTLGTAATAVDGAPLGTAMSGTFRTDAVSSAPVIERVYSACRSGDTWTELAPSIDALDTGQSIAMQFSRDMDAASVRSSIQLEPSQSGIVDIISPRLAILTPEHGWPPELAMALVVSADVMDLTGLRMGHEYRVSFMPATPYLGIVGVETANGERATEFSDSEILVTSPGSQPDGIVSLALCFSAPFDAVAMVLASQCIHLTTLFPSNIPSPSMRSIYWPSNATAVFTWEGLRPSDEVSTIYYRLLVEGGATGVESEDNLHLRDDAVLLLEMSR
ncbi:MAG TPA: hypothetical protein VMX33_06610 [bacterium]|nr:hypothetical protein [bacterium]